MNLRCAFGDGFAQNLTPFWERRPAWDWSDWLGGIAVVASGDPKLDPPPNRIQGSSRNFGPSGAEFAPSSIQKAARRLGQISSRLGKASSAALIGGGANGRVGRPKLCHRGARGPAHRIQSPQNFGPNDGGSHLIGARATRLPAGPGPGPPNRRGWVGSKFGRRLGGRRGQARRG
jgi:hypothetical protein